MNYLLIFFNESILSLLKKYVFVTPGEGDLRAVVQHNTLQNGKALVSFIPCN